MLKWIGFIVSSLIGFVIGHYLLDGAPAAYASILISYHLYLIFLVVLVIREEKGLAMPLSQALLTHMAFLGILIGLPYMREQIPLFGLLRLLVPGLAPFESKWLFSRAGASEKKVEADASIDMHQATNEDHDAFREYLKREHRPFRKPGWSLNQEFNAWLNDRRTKAATGVPVGAERAAK
jgi:hypothetical protein